MSECDAGIVVLAAGASERMGEPKQLLRLGGETLVGRAVRVALASRCRPAIVVLGARAEEVRGEVDESGARVVVNEDWSEGMGSSIRLGVAALDEATEGRARAVVLTLCDQPNVTAELLDRLVDVFLATGSPVVASEYEAEGARVRGVPALFSRALFGELASLGGHEGARRVVERHSAEAAFVAAPEAAVDVDTPRDYAALRDAEGADRPAGE